MRAFIALFTKDLALFLADKRGALLAFVVPIVLASGFGVVFAKPTDQPNTVQLPILLTTDDSGPFGLSLAQELQASPRFQVTCCTQADVAQRLADRRPGIAINLPADLERLKSWRPGSRGPHPHVEILHHPLCASESQWAEGIVTEVLLRKMAREQLGPTLGAAVATVPFDVTVREANGHHSGFNSYAHSFSGMTLQYLLFWGMESGLLLLRDRQRSVWLRLRAAPVSLPLILASKAASTAFVAFCQVLTTFGFGALVFGVQFTGSWLGFLLLAVVVSALAASTGLLVAALGGTEMRARSVCILVILGVSMLGGLWLPSFLLPNWARDLSLCLPTSWAMRGFDATTWQGCGFVSVLPNVAVVFAFAAAFLGLATFQLLNAETRRRRGDRP